MSPRNLNQIRIKDTIIMMSKSIVYINPAVSHFYETEYEIWSALGPVGSTENYLLIV